MWLRQENIALPAIVPGSGRRPIEWKVPVYHTLHHMLTNPVYAGAYAFGRRRARVSIEDGRKRTVRSLRRTPAEWEVLIKDHHPGYITWEEFVTPLSQLTGQQGREFRFPLADGFVAEDDAALEEHLAEVLQREAIAQAPRAPRAR